MKMDDLISREEALQPTQTNTPNTLNALDTIYRQTAIDALCRRCDLVSDGTPCTEKCNDIKTLEMMPSAQPELIERTAYIRGFEQGRTQGIIDAQERKK